MTRRMPVGCFACGCAIVMTIVAVTAQQGGQASPTPPGREGAPGGRGLGVLAPPPIVWAAPPLPDGPILVQSAVPEHRNLRVVVMTKALSHPWGLAFLPDGSILITEREGRLRIFRPAPAQPGQQPDRAALDPTPVAGLPPVSAERLQGLMDIALHPRFAENRFVYLSYHKPSSSNARVTSLARARDALAHCAHAIEAR